MPYATLEVFEAVTRGRICIASAILTGFSGVPGAALHNGVFPKHSRTLRWHRFGEDKFRGDLVRVVALLQPVYDGQSYRMVTAQVAETLNYASRRTAGPHFNALDRQVIF